MTIMTPYFPDAKKTQLVLNLNREKTFPTGVTNNLNGGY